MVHADQKHVKSVKRLTSMLEYRPEGLFCPPAGIFIDPRRSVERAVVTHAHSDHARRGHKSYACHQASVPLLRHRLGRKIVVEGFEYGSGFSRNGVNFTFHPSGHMPGAAQIRISYKDEVWVVSGDFKLENDGLVPAWEALRCDGLITESTFALPVFRWKPQERIAQEIHQWWSVNHSQGIASILTAYSLGKAQRLIHLLHSHGLRIFVHPNIRDANQAVAEAGFNLPELSVIAAGTAPPDVSGGIVIIPAGARAAPWMRQLGPVSIASASGWFQLPARRLTNFGFVLSDHADWDGLNTAVEACGAENVIVAHGYEAVFARWLREQGRNAWEESRVDPSNERGTQ